MFQKDLSPFTKAEPADRKKVLGDALSLDPVLRAHRVLNEERLVKQRALFAAEQAVKNAADFQPSRGREVCAAALQKAQEQAQAAQEALKVAQAAYLTAEKAEEVVKALVRDLQGRLTALPDSSAALAGKRGELSSRETALGASKERLLVRWRAEKARLKELEAKALPDIEALRKQRAELAAGLPALESAFRAAESAVSTAETELDALPDSSATLAAAKSAVTTAQATQEEAAARLRGSLDGHRGRLTVFMATPAPGLEEVQALQRAQALVVEGCAQRVVELRKAVGAAREEMARLKATVFSNQERVDTLTAAEPGTCPECDQPVSADHLTKKIEDWSRLLKSTKDLEVVAAAHAEKVEKELREAETAHTDAQATLKTADATVASVESWEATKTQLQLRIQEAAAELALATDAHAKKLSALNAEVERLEEVVAAEIKTASGARATLTAAKDWLSHTQAAVVNAQARLAPIAQELINAEHALTARQQATAAIAAIEKENSEAKAEHAAYVETTTKEIEALVETVAAEQVIRSETQKALNDAQFNADNEASVRSAAGKAKDDALAAQGGAQTALQAAEAQCAAWRQWDEMTGENQKTLETATAISATADIACAILDPKGGLPVYLVDSRLPFLEERINYYMDRLNMADIRISLSTLEEDKETLEVLVDNGGPWRLDIRAYSGGELDRVEIALKLAMTDLSRDVRGSAFGLLCFDEPTGGLDTDGKDALATILFERAGADYPAVYIISHDDRLNSHFSRRLRATKTPPPDQVTTLTLD